MRALLASSRWQGFYVLPKERPARSSKLLRSHDDAHGDLGCGCALSGRNQSWSQLLVRSWVPMCIIPGRRWPKQEPFYLTRNSSCHAHCRAFPVRSESGCCAMHTVACASCLRFHRAPNKMLCVLLISWNCEYAGEIELSYPGRVFRCSSREAPRICCARSCNERNCRSTIQTGFVCCEQP
jgi:hypothetical protein